MTDRQDDRYDLIFELVRHIPPGRVSTYGAISAALGAKSGARLVGYALHRSHSVLPSVPAHRVVNRNGVLTGKFHFGSHGEMQKLLESEGVEVKGDRVIRFPELFWDPVREWIDQ